MICGIFSAADLLFETPEETMTVYSVTLDPSAAEFYRRLAQTLGLPVETVLADALFKLAGELSLEALYKAKYP